MARKYRESSSNQLNPSRLETRTNIPSTKPSNSLKIRLDDMKTIELLTENQKRFMNSYRSGDDVIVAHGVAGTGKTYLALYSALETVLDRNNRFEKVIIIRSAVQGRSQGFLPGDQKEKLEVYSAPYRQICENLFNRKDAWDRLEEQHHIEFMSTSFLRGTTFDNCIIIMDEFQNENYATLETVITRVGLNSRIIFSGDCRQTDLKDRNDLSGAKQFMDVLRLTPDHTRIEYGVEDIVRSRIAKDFIIAALKHQDSVR
jgi:phosphate starvation-inducible PhoH-like protein